MLHRAQVLLIGTATHVPRSRLRDEPAVASTVQDLGRVLVERCGVPGNALTICADPPSPRDFGDALQGVTERAADDDVLLVCYAGHGLTNAEGQLYLATRESGGDGRVEHTAWPYAILRRYVLDSRARTKVVILDCCFSGKAIGALGTDEIGNAAEIAGTYVLTSAERNEYALVLPGERHTAFLGALIELIERGDPEGEQHLTVEAVFRHLSRVLPTKGCPRPVGRWQGLAGGLVLAPNRAWRSRGTRDLARPRAREPGQDVCPYPGLEAFSAADSAFFFGREKLTGELVGELARRYDDPCSLLVMGSSGSGKSSVLRAGLIPAVGRGDLAIAGSSGWPVVAFTPTAHPVAALAAAVAPLVDAGQADELARRPEALAEALRAALGRGRAVLLVDQFEEVFTQCADEAERRAFLSGLHAAWSGLGGEPVALVVIGVRADFFGRCAEYPELAQTVSRHTVVVGSMAAGEVRDAIVRPAARAGLTLEPGLAELLLTDLGVRERDELSYEAGRLPLLAHALRTTWRLREDGMLTVDAYRRIGGIYRALAATADRALDRLDERGREAARHLLLRLVHVGDGSDDTRARVARDRLVDRAPDPGMARVALDALLADDARLVTVDGDTVQITHEALLHSWPRLRSWIDADRADLRVRQRLSDEAAAWERGGRRPGDLAKGTSLAIVRDWSGEPGRLAMLDGLTRAFAEFSVRRARRRRNAVIAGFLALSLLLTFTAVQWRTANEQREVAEDRNRVATARRLVAEADVRRDSDPATALRMNLAAYDLAPRTGAVRDEATGALTAVVLDSGLPAPVAAHQGPVTAVAFDPAGGLMATGGEDSAVHLWDVRDPPVPRRIATLHGHRGKVASLSFGPRGSILAVTDTSGQLLIWDARHARQMATLPVRGAVTSVAFGRYTPILATGGANGRATLWDLRDPARPHRVAGLGGRGEPISAVTISPDDDLLVTAAPDAGVRLWDLSEPGRPRATVTIRDRNVMPLTVAFAPDGTRLAIAGRNLHPLGTPPFGLWDVTNTDKPRLIGGLGMRADDISQVAFSPTGKRLLTYETRYKTVVVWDGAGVQQTSLTFPTDVMGLGFDPEGRLLAAGGADGRIRLLVLTSPAAPRPRGFIPNFEQEFAQSPDGSVLATTAGLELYLWDPRQAPRRLTTLHMDQHTAWLAFSGDGSTLAVVSYAEENNLTLWDVRDPTTPRRVGALPVRAQPMQSSATFHPRASILAVTEDRGPVALWDVREAARPRRLAALPGSGGEPAFDADGTLLATSDTGRSPFLWDVSRPSAPRGIDLPGMVAPGTLAFGGRGGRRLLAVSQPGNAVALWSLGDLRRPSLATLLTSSYPVNALTFNPRGDVLVVGTEAIWRQRTRFGAPPADDDRWGRAESALFYVVTAPSAPRRIPAMGGPQDLYPPHLFTPDGRGLIAVSSGRHLALWDVRALDDMVTNPLERGCVLAGHGLRASEWEQYAPGVAYEPGCAGS
ncbi:WD40 repeat domain-containing protein [Nonomuraea sp. SYSU D8015]|uniref:WD40 repeat domain-containing protein n=1 Tax=Nonomuraea sp. SYSU D8015 TaxID=2593644 RepID=UPI001660DB1D|nr:WD40 repeat domain-containing protein [Nonomuraea sp. SYSU D8015]